MRRLPIITAIAACSAATAAAGPVEFLDQTFDPGDYTIVFVEGPGGQAASQDSDGGASGTSPDPYRRVVTLTNAYTETRHLHNAFVLDPATASVGSIELSIDVRAINAFGQGMAFGFAFMQDGVIRTFANDITNSDPDAFQWRTHTVTMTPMDVPDLDFSSLGAPIQFGFRTANSGGEGIAVGFDNLRVTVMPAGCPEDLDGDGFVGFSDLNLVLADFNTMGAGLPGDVDGDGDADFNDLNLIVSVFNTGC